MSNRGSEGEGRVTIAQAATLLGVHPNTVRNRVKAGVYDAEKVMTESGQTWMIERNSLLNKPLPKGSQQTPSQWQGASSPQTTDVVRDLLAPFIEELGKVKEDLGAERVRREQAERERDELATQLEALRESRESPVTSSEGQSSSSPPTEQQEPTSRRSWWRWFLGLE